MAISAKPFLKWAGGKTQLLGEIEKLYQLDGVNKYVEPFIGGGAVFFDILNKHKFDEIYINDVNQNLICTYTMVRDKIDDLICLLAKFQEEYISFDFDSEFEQRKKYYLAKRSRFNQLKADNNSDYSLEKAALLIFLNKTCFNGLYRVNKSGLYNVPMGKYKKPVICDLENLRAVSKCLQGVTISCGHYDSLAKYIDKDTFVYCDPPYRPLTQTAAFTSYTENDFDDNEQRNLAKFARLMSKKGTKIVISNSDPKNIDEDDNFFDDLYAGFNIRRVKAGRMINSNGTARGKISELLISNF